MGHDPGLAGRPGIAVGGMGRPLLVADQDVLDLVLLVEGVVDMQRRAARIAENMFDTFVLQTAHDDVRTR
jgi:carbamate kinase